MIPFLYTKLMSDQNKLNKKLEANDQSLFFDLTHMIFDRPKDVFFRVRIIKENPQRHLNRTHNAFIEIKKEILSQKDENKFPLYSTLPNFKNDIQIKDNLRLLNLQNNNKSIIYMFKSFMYVQ